MFDLSKPMPWEMQLSHALVKTVATNEFMRALSFIPLIATTAVTAGVYGWRDLPFIAQQVTLSESDRGCHCRRCDHFLEVMMLGLIGKFLETSHL